MLIHLFSIRDLKAEAYNDPFYAPTTAVALRLFETNVKDPNSDLAKYPADYRLYEVGSFNRETGELAMLETPRDLGLATDFVPEDNVHALRQA